MRDFDKHFERTQKLAMAVWLFGLVLTLALIGFGVWVVIVLLKFFGVI